MKITGELLKSERINQGLSIQQVSLALKLSPKIISAIESGNSEELPAKTFVRGFVKSYSEYLKMDPVVVLRQFQEEMGSTAPLPKTAPPKPAEAPAEIRASRPAVRHTSQNYSHEKGAAAASIKKQNLEQKNTNNKILISLFAAAFLIIFIILVNRFFTDSEVQIAAGSAAQSQSDSTDIVIPTFDNVDPAMVSQGSSSDSSAAGTSGEVTAVGSNSASATAVATNVSDAKSAVSSTTATTGSSITTTNAVPPSLIAVQDSDLPASQGKPVELMFEPKKDIEIQYAKGNQKNFKVLKLAANKLQVLRSQSGLHIKASDGGAFKIIVNGVDIGFAGQNNKPVKLSF
jgi:cytoskeleton protein RodZ